MSNQPEIMNKDNQNLRIKLLSFSPWILGSACILLLLVIAFFAVSNYEREKSLITQGLEHKGLTLVRFIDSSVSGSVRSMVMSSSPYDQWEAHMQPALELAVEQPGVDSIVLVDKDANVLLSAGSDQHPRDKVDGEFLRLLKDYGKGGEVSSQITVIKSNGKRENKAVLKHHSGQPFYIKLICFYNLNIAEASCAIICSLDRTFKSSLIGKV